MTDIERLEDSMKSCIILSLRNAATLLESGDFDKMEDYEKKFVAGNLYANFLYLKGKYGLFDD